MGLDKIVGQVDFEVRQVTGQTICQLTVLMYSKKM